VRVTNASRLDDASRAAVVARGVRDPPCTETADRYAQGERGSASRVPWGQRVVDIGLGQPAAGRPTSGTATTGDSDASHWERPQSLGYPPMMTAARGLLRLATQCGGRHVVTDDVTTARLKSPTPTQPRAIAALLHEKDMGGTAPDFVSLGPAYRSAVMLAPKKTHHRLNETMQTSAGSYSVKVMPIHKILRRLSGTRRRRSAACITRVLPRPVTHRPASTLTRSASK